MFFCVAYIGAVANVAPSILGYLYGQASSGQESSGELAGLLESGICFCYFACAFCFAMSALSKPTEEGNILP